MLGSRGKYSKKTTSHERGKRENLQTKKGNGREGGDVGRGRRRATLGQGRCGVIFSPVASIARILLPGLAGGLIQVADGLGGLVALVGVLLVLYSVTAYGPRLMLLLTGLILPVAAVAGSITLLQRGTGVERLAAIRRWRLRGCCTRWGRGWCRGGSGDRRGRLPRCPAAPCRQGNRSGPQRLPCQMHAGA